MTYNFDPDQWYENEVDFFEKKYHSGAISEQKFNNILKELGTRYDDMLERLNGTYQIS